MHKPSPAQGAHTPRRGGAKPLAIVSSLGLTLATMSAGITATTAETIPNPTPNNPSAYQDDYGRNVVGPEALPKLNPSVKGGSTPVAVGDKTEYEFTLDTGFPEDPENITGQRWIKITLTEDPQVPFDKDPQGNLIVQGLPEGTNITKSGEHSWEAVLGAEYLDMDTQGYAINNPAHADFNAASDTAWQPPSKLELTIPATVASTDGEGSFAQGKAELTSGRLAVVGLEDDQITPRFISNDGAGQCTWEASYHAALVGQDAGHWLNGIIVQSAPAETDHFASLPSAYKYIKPEMLQGTVRINDQEKIALDALNPPALDGDRTTYTIGEHVVDLNMPPFYTTEWLPAESKVSVIFQYTNPCGEKVDADVVDNPRDYIEGVAGPSRLLPEYTFVQSNKVELVISRPPEDATATAEYTFTKAEPEAPDAEFSVAKTLAAGQGDVQELDDGSFTTSHVITVRNQNPGTMGTSDEVIDTIREVPGFEPVRVTVDGWEKQLDENSFTVSPGVDFFDADPATKDFQVEVTYQRVGEAPEGYEKAFTTEEAEAIGECVARDEESDEFPENLAGQGIINTVELGADNAADKDAQGRGNNWDCLTVVPKKDTPLVPGEGDNPPVPGEGEPEEGDNPPTPDEGENPPVTPTGSSFGWLIPLIGLIGGGGAIIGSSIGSSLGSSTGSSTPPESSEPAGEKPKVEKPRVEQPQPERHTPEAQPKAKSQDSASQPIAREVAGEQGEPAPVKKGMLANTGVSVLAPLGVGVLLLLIGAALAAIRRKA